MKNGIRRGNVYRLRMDSGIGSEMAVSRPAVVISSDKGNQKTGCVIIVYGTSKPKYGKLNASVTRDGKTIWFLGNQLATIDKSRLDAYLYTTTEDEMYDIEEAVLYGMDIKYDDHDDQIETEDEEIEEGESLEEKYAALELELEIANAKFDRLLEKYVEMKIDSDVKVKVEPPTIIVSPKEAPPAVKPIDINSCSEKALKEIGWEATVAKNIVAKRPFESIDDIKSVSGVTKKCFDLLLPKMICVPAVEKIEPVVEKANINTMTGPQIKAILGCNKAYAGYIVTHRNRNGKFVDIEELLMVKNLPTTFFEQYKDRVEI